MMYFERDIWAFAARGLKFREFLAEVVKCWNLIFEIV